jgi:hypothetical protein
VSFIPRKLLHFRNDRRIERIYHNMQDEITKIVVLLAESNKIAAAAAAVAAVAVVAVAAAAAAAAAAAEQQQQQQRQRLQSQRLELNLSVVKQLSH